MIFAVIFAVLLLITAGEALTAPQATGDHQSTGDLQSTEDPQSTGDPQATETPSPSPQGCVVPDYGPFKLFPTRKDTGATYTARLLPDANGVTSHMIVSTNPICTGCGDAPSYWQLNSMVLFATNSVTGASSVNQFVDSGSQLNFINVKTPHPIYGIYCPESIGSTTPPVLSVDGNSTAFSMCAFTSTSPPPTTWTIDYQQSGGFHPVGEHCYPVNLVMELIT